MKPLQYELHLRLGQLCNSIKQYGLAVMHYHSFFDILRRNNRADYYLSSSAFYDMSYSLYHTYDYAGCIEAGLNAMFALPNAPYMPDDSLNAYQRMQAWNIIGLAYHKSQQYDSAFQAFSNSEQVASELNTQIWLNQLFISGDEFKRIFNVNAGITATIRDIALIDGNSQGTFGNCIRSFGILTLQNVRMSSYVGAENPSRYSVMTEQLHSRTRFL